MIPIVLLFIDILASACLSDWLVFSTLMYFFVLVLHDRGWQQLMPAGLAYLLVDFAQYGRFGLGLIFLLPAYFLLTRLKNTLFGAQLFVLTVCVVSFALWEYAFTEGFLFGRVAPVFVTNVKIFINLVLGYVVFWGVRGNRFFTRFLVRGRKVWTPNRIDAS